MQFNFTDGASRIMLAGDGNIVQGFNAQAVIDTEGSMLLVGGYVTNHSNDKKELVPALVNIDQEVRIVSEVCADTGYFSETAVKTVEVNGTGPVVYCAIERQGHHRTVADLEWKSEPEEPPQTASVKERMAYRLKTTEGRSCYTKRKETIEPAYGIIKSVLGFRQFLLRGLEQVGIEWDLVMLAYNFKRLYRLEVAIPATGT